MVLKDMQPLNQSLMWKPDLFGHFSTRKLN